MHLPKSVAQYLGVHFPMLVGQDHPVSKEIAEAAGPEPVEMKVVEPLFSFNSALVSELASRFYDTQHRGAKARTQGIGSIPCSTCEATISANKVQCRECKEATEFLLLTIGKAAADKMPKGLRPDNPEAEARITELGRRYAVEPQRSLLMHFAFYIAQAKHPGVVTIAMAVREVEKLLTPFTTPEPWPPATAEAVSCIVEHHRADDDGMAQAA